MLKDKLKMSGELDIVVRGKDGKVKEKKKVKNLVVTVGLTYICSRMKDATATAMTHMGIGSGTTAAGQTDLVTLLGSREALDSTTASTSTIAYVSSFEAGDGTGAVTEAGIFNASTSGTMLCRSVFSAINKGADDTMTITWTLTLSAS